jgi:hypothetical protein
MAAASAAVDKIAPPPPPPPMSERASSEAFAAPPPIRVTPKRADHRPTRSSPLALQKPASLMTTTSTNNNASAPPSSRTKSPLSDENESFPEDEQTPEQTSDDISLVEKATTQRAAALTAFEERLNESEAQIRKILTNLSEQVETGLEKKLGKLNALTTVVNAEAERIAEMRRKAMEEKDYLLETHVDMATLETEELILKLQQRANALLEAHIQQKRNGTWLRRLVFRPMTWTFLFAVAAFVLVRVLGYDDVGED